MNYTYLNFPKLSDFLEWLRSRGIHLAGKVITQEMHSGEKGSHLVTYAYKITAKDPDRLEIVQCPLPFYRGIYLTQELTEKEAEPAEEKMKGYIDKTIKSFCEQMSWQIQIIAAEFKVGEEA